MEKHLYLILYPVDALVASMLPPEKFARHFAVGSAKHFEGKTMFIEVDPGFRSPELPIDEALKLCLPHPDGSPKKTKYISIYNSLGRVDLSALGDMFLVTIDGRSLQLEQKPCPEPCGGARIRLFHLICPLNFPVAVNLTPEEYGRYVTKEIEFKAVPKICFSELRINAGTIAEAETPPDYSPLPNTHRVHLWKCINELAKFPEKRTKTLSIQDVFAELSFLRLKHGFWLSDGETLIHYPLPSYDDIKYQHPNWWKSA